MESTMPRTAITAPLFCGQKVTDQQLDFIRSITHQYKNLSRTELSATLCELLGWVRQNGKPKSVEARAYLEKLEQQQRITLPPQRKKRAKSVSVRIPPVEPTEPVPIRTTLKQLQPIRLQRVSSPDQRNQWRSLVDQHHYLGHKIPFGAHLRYLIQAEAGVLGCLQYSSPAWSLHSRDRWIGWNESQRKNNLQHILCNSRFLILPWVQVPNLASHVLSKSVEQILTDWPEHYHVTPWLLESMVDSHRFSGTCYRAANWINVGETSGRGRNDRHHQRHAVSPKSVWLYPLHAHSRDKLCQGA
jgi:hypothetical protein